MRPGGPDWGFLDAVTAGFQGAAAVLRFLITGIIALVPVFAIIAVVWLVVRAIRRRRRNAAGDGAVPGADDGAA